MNKYSLFASVLLLILCLLYCHFVEGVPANQELIWHAIKMVFSSWTGRCCGTVICALFTFGLCC